MKKKKEEKVRFTSMFILDVMLQLCRSSFCLHVFSCFGFLTYIMRIRIYVYMSCCVTGGRASCASPEIRVAGLCTSPNYVYS